MADLNPRIDFLDVVSDDIPDGESVESSSSRTISVCLKSSIVGNYIIYFETVQWLDVPTISVEVSRVSQACIWCCNQKKNKTAL